jgi:hypothetical protein
MRRLAATSTHTKPKTGIWTNQVKAHAVPAQTSAIDHVRNMSPPLPRHSREARASHDTVNPHSPDEPDVAAQDRSAPIAAQYRSATNSSQPTSPKPRPHNRVSAACTISDSGAAPRQGDRTWQPSKSQGSQGAGLVPPPLSPFASQPQLAQTQRKLRSRPAATSPQ